MNTIKVLGACFLMIAGHRKEECCCISISINVIIISISRRPPPLHAEARIHVVKYCMNMRNDTAPNKRDNLLKRKGQAHFQWQALYFGDMKLIFDDTRGIS